MKGSSMKKFVKAAPAFLLLLVVSLSSCLSSAGAAREEGPSYYERVAPSIATLTLSNGIPVAFKRNDANRVLSLNLIIEGGSSLIPAERAGLESVALSMLTHGSLSHPYEEIQALLYAKSAGIAASAGYDYGVYGLSCIDKYFGEIFPVWASGFLEPAMEPLEFEKVVDDALQAAQQRLDDPDAFARSLGTAAIYSGGPYEADPSGTPDSLGSLGLDDVLGWHEAAMDAERLSLVAVGNWDEGELMAALEAAFGSLPSRGGIKAPETEPNCAGPLLKEAHESAEGVLYLQGFFPIPGRAHPDYVPFAMAMDMLDDISFSVVREKHGACYSIGTIFRPAASSHGIVWVYQSADPEGIKQWLDEAVSLLASGKVILMKDPDSGEFVTASVAERLEAYKAKYANAVYGSQRTNGQIADSIARSLAYFGDPAEYLRVMEKIEAVSPADIERVLEDWFLDASFRWVAVSDQGILDRLPEDAFPEKSFRALK